MECDEVARVETDPDPERWSTCRDELGVQSEDLDLHRQRASRGARGRERYEQMQADGTLDKIARLNEHACARGQTLAQMALAWLLRDPRVTSVLIGVSRPEQLAENLEVAKAAPLSEDELERIERILAGE